jgi:hypothetical protein
MLSTRRPIQHCSKTVFWSTPTTWWSRSPAPVDSGQLPALKGPTPRRR